MTEMVVRGEGDRAGGLPRAVFFGAAVLIAFALAASAFTRLSGVGAVHLTHGGVVESLSLRFEDQADGSVAVRNASNGKVIFVAAPGTNFFLRATLRGLAQERLRSDVGSEIPFSLTHWSDGALSLEDPSNHRTVALEVFGPTNAQVFAQLFDAERATP